MAPLVDASLQRQRLDLYDILARSRISRDARRLIAGICGLSLPELSAAGGFNLPELLAPHPLTFLLGAHPKPQLLIGELPAVGPDESPVTTTATGRLPRHHESAQPRRGDGLLREALTWVNVLPNAAGYWAVGLRDVRVEYSPGSSTGSGESAPRSSSRHRSRRVESISVLREMSARRIALDTGSSLMMAPEQDIGVLLQHIGACHAKQGGHRGGVERAAASVADQTASDETAGPHLEADPLSKLPTIVFEVELNAGGTDGGTTRGVENAERENPPGSSAADDGSALRDPTIVELRLTPETYASAGTEGCALALQPIGLPPEITPMWIFGQAFFRKYAASFDFARRRVGLAEMRRGTLYT